MTAFVKLPVRNEAIELLELFDIINATILAEVMTRVINPALTTSSHLCDNVFGFIATARLLLNL